MRSWGEPCFHCGGHASRQQNRRPARPTWSEVLPGAAPRSLTGRHKIHLAAHQAAVRHLAEARDPNCYGKRPGYALPAPTHPQLPPRAPHRTSSLRLLPAAASSKSRRPELPSPPHAVPRRSWVPPRPALWLPSGFAIATHFLPGW